MLTSKLNMSSTVTDKPIQPHGDTNAPKKWFWLIVVIIFYSLHTQGKRYRSGVPGLNAQFWEHIFCKASCFDLAFLILPWSYGVWPLVLLSNLLWQQVSSGQSTACSRACSGQVKALSSKLADFSLGDTDLNNLALQLTGCVGRQVLAPVCVCLQVCIHGHTIGVICEEIMDRAFTRWINITSKVKQFPWFTSP